MKKLLLFAFAAFLLASCGGSKTDKAIILSEESAATETTVDSNETPEKPVAESAVADTTAKPAPVIEAVEEEKAKPAEDSFAKKIPNPEKIFWKGNCGKYLKSLGFIGSTKPNYSDDYEDEYSGSYTLSMGNKKCTVRFECDMHFANVKVTIIGDNEALNSFYKKAKKLESSGFESGTNVTKSGNTVTIDGFGA